MEVHDTSSFQHDKSQRNSRHFVTLRVSSQMSSSLSDARSLYTGRDSRHYSMSYERRRPKSIRFPIQSPLPKEANPRNVSEDSRHFDTITRFFSDEKFAFIRSFTLHRSSLSTLLCVIRTTLDSSRTITDTVASHDVRLTIFGHGSCPLSRLLWCPFGPNSFIRQLGITINQTND